MSHRDFRGDLSRRDGAIHLLSQRRPRRRGQRRYSSGNASRTLGYCGVQLVERNFSFVTRLPVDGVRRSETAATRGELVRMDSARSQRREG